MYLHFLFCLTRSTDDINWVKDVFMSGVMGPKSDMEREERLTFHILQRDSQVGNVEAINVIDAINYSKRVIIILSA